MYKCLLCNTVLEEHIHAIEYQFCGNCISKLRILKINIDNAETVLKDYMLRDH